MACCRLQGKKGEFFVNRVYDLGAEGLHQGALGTDVAAEEVATGA